MHKLVVIIMLKNFYLCLQLSLGNRDTVRKQKKKTEINGLRLMGVRPSIDVQ